MASNFQKGPHDFAHLRLSLVKFSAGIDEVKSSWLQFCDESISFLDAAVEIQVLLFEAALSLLSFLQIATARPFQSLRNIDFKYQGQIRGENLQFLCQRVNQTGRNHPREPRISARGYVVAVA